MEVEEGSGFEVSSLPAMGFQTVKDERFDCGNL